METFLHLFRDPGWQFVGVVLTLGIGGITIKLALLQRSYKALCYEILSQASLQQGDKDLMGLLEISFDHKPVRDVYLVKVKLYNSGNVPILSADYDKPISIGFGKRAKILRAEVMGREPFGLPIIMDVVNERELALHPALLNPGDAFILQVLVDQPDVRINQHSYAEKVVDVTVVGRIVGVKEIQNSPYKKSIPFCSLAYPKKKHLEIPFSRLRRCFIKGTTKSVALTSEKPALYVPPAVCSLLHEEKDEQNEAETIITPGNQLHAENKATASNDDDDEDLPMVQWENLSKDQIALYFKQASASLKDSGILAPSHAVLENMSKGLWHEENATRLGIYKAYQSAKARAKNIPTEDAVRKASRRLPETDTKD